VELACQSLIVEGKERTVGGEHCGRLRKTRLVMRQAGRQLGCIRWIAHQHGEARDESAVHFVQQHLATELGWQVRFASPHDGRVRFEQTHQLGGGGHTFTVEHASFSLRDDLADQRRDVLQRGVHSLDGRIRAALQGAAPDLVLSEVERLWVRACWQAAAANRKEVRR
jgi:hypothetical protein